MKSLYNSPQKIFCISIILGLIGLCFSFFAIPIEGHVVFDFSPFLLDTSILSIYIKDYMDFGKEGVYQPFSSFFSTLLLVGSIIYKKTKDTRLLSFCLSLVFFSAVSGMLIYIVYGIKIFSLCLLGCVLFFIYGTLSFLMLKSIMKKTELVTESYELMGDTITNYVDTPTRQRFIHLAIDISIIFITIIPFILFMGTFVGDSGNDHFISVFLYIVFTIYSFLYYIIFEGFLGTTPGKLLLSNKVIETGTNNPELTKESALLRTICRVVPFERVAFLLGYKWHDNWTKTNVVKVWKSGGKGVYYWIGIVLLLHLASFWGVKIYKEYNKEQVQSSELQSRIDLLKSNIENINTDFFLSFSNYSKYVYPRTKVEKITGDTLYCMIISDGWMKSSEMYDKYLKMKNSGDTLSILKVNRKDLLASIGKKIDKNRQHFSNGMMSIDGDSCFLNGAFTLLGPVFDPDITFSKIEENKVSIRMDYSGEKPNLSVTESSHNKLAPFSDGQIAHITDYGDYIICELQYSENSYYKEFELNMENTDKYGTKIHYYLKGDPDNDNRIWFVELTEW